MADPYASVAPDESGSTTAQIQTADGKITMVTVRPDGTIVRDQTYTDDQGRKVMVRFDSGDGSKQETVTDLTNGAKFVTTTATNGDRTVEEHVVYDDGSVEVDTTFPDGSTKGEHIANLPNGGERHTISYSNGAAETRTITKDTTGNSHEVHVDTAGRTTTTDTMPGPNGLVHQIIVTPDGERIDQSTQDYTDADGNTVHVESGAWGSTTGIRHTDGSTDERTELADGSTLTKTWTQYPDGTTERVETDAEGVSNTVLQTKNPDGSYTTKATDIDGRVVEHVVQSDGTVRSTIREPGDGGVTRSVTMADGTGETSFQAPGEEPHVVTNDRVLPMPVTDATDATGSAMPSLDDTPAAEPDPALTAGPAPQHDGPVLLDAFGADDRPVAAGDGAGGTTGAAAPTGQITTDSFGQTKVEVPATDGLVTTILVANDGTTTRMQSWDDASTGAHVTHYAYPDGTSAEERTNQDGSTSRVTSDDRGNGVQLDTQRIDQDGTVVKETQYADGRPSEVTTTSTTYEIDDGSTVEKTQAPDNSVTTKTTFRDGHSEQITQHPDGTTERATSVVQPDGTQVDRVTDASGAETVTQTTHEPQGLIRAVTTHPDGTTEERVDQNYVNASGDVVEVHEADGQRVESVTRRDGSIDTHTVHSDGTTEQTSFNTFPNGVSVRNTTLGDGRTQSVTQTKSADGAVITQKIDFDGTKHDHTVHLDGSSVSETTQVDGTQEKITSQPNGAATVQYQAPGEDEHVVTRQPDLPYPLDGRVVDLGDVDTPAVGTLDPPPPPTDPNDPDQADDTGAVDMGQVNDPINSGDPTGASGTVSDSSTDHIALGDALDTGAGDVMSAGGGSEGFTADSGLQAGVGAQSHVGDDAAARAAQGPGTFSVDDLNNPPDDAPDPDITGAGTVRAGVPGASQAAAGAGAKGSADSASPDDMQGASGNVLSAHPGAGPGLSAGEGAGPLTQATAGDEAEDRGAEGPGELSVDDLNTPADAPPDDDVLGTGSAGAMAAPATGSDAGASEAAAGAGAKGTAEPGPDDWNQVDPADNASGGAFTDDASADTTVVPDVTAPPPADDFSPQPIDDAPATDDDSAFSDM